MNIFTPKQQIELLKQELQYTNYSDCTFNWVSYYDNKFQNLAVSCKFYNKEKLSYFITYATRSLAEGIYKINAKNVSIVEEEYLFLDKRDNQFALTGILKVSFE